MQASAPFARDGALRAPAAPSPCRPSPRRRRNRPATRRRRRRRWPEQASRRVARSAATTRWPACGRRRATACCPRTSPRRPTSTYSRCAEPAPLYLGDRALDRVIAAVRAARARAHAGGCTACACRPGRAGPNAATVQRRRTQADPASCRDSSQRSTVTVSRLALPTNEAVKREGGWLIQRLRAAHVHQPALVHDRDAIGERQRLDLVVRDVENRHVGQLAMQSRDLVQHAAAQLRVECRQRLVEQQHLGSDGERAGDRHALLLPARELLRVPSARSLPCRRACRHSSTRDAISPRGAPPARRPKATFCSTRMCGNSAYCCTTMPMPRRYGGICVTSVSPEENAAATSA